MPPTRYRGSTAASLFAPPGRAPRRDPYYLPTAREEFVPIVTQPFITVSNTGAPQPYPGTLTPGSAFGGPYEPVRGIGYPYQGYARNMTQPQGGLGAALGTRPTTPASMGQGYPYDYTRNLPHPEPGWTPPTRPTAPTTPTTGAGGAGAARPEAPPGLEGWYQQFAQEHGGQTPEEFYANVGRYGEGLEEALEDREWSREFQRATGRSPSDDEWRLHYYQSRGGEWAAMSRAERKEERRRARKRGMKQWAKSQGWDRPEEYDAAIAEGWALPGMTRTEAEFFKLRIEAGLAEPPEGTPLAQKKEEEEKAKEKPPLYKPPQVSWR